MSELISQAFRLVNLPFTILLILVVVYWLLAAIGAVGGEHADTDLDVHAHADLDHDVDVDTDIDGLHHHVEGNHGGHAEHGGGSTWYGVLKFVNLGDVPVMIVLSVLTLSGWAFSMLANFYFTNGSPALIAAALGANLVFSVVATRYVTLPLKPLFRLMKKNFDGPSQIVGRHCRIVTSEATPSFGQAEIATNGVPLLIHVRTLNDAVLNKGDCAVIVREDGDRRIFFVTANPIPTH